MTLWKVILLGFIQGATEFLPVSSSGHLAILQNILRMEDPHLTFSIFLHAGTLVAIIIYFAKDIGKMLWGIIKFWDKTLHNQRRLFAFVILGSGPIAISGYFLEGLVEQSFTSLKFVSIMLMITGLWIFLAEKAPNRKRPLRPLNSILIGIAQAVAIFPGISRSGATISTGLLAGVKRKEAFRFSFLLAIPAVSGAFILRVWRMDEVFVAQHFYHWIGAVVSFLVGLASLVLLRFMISYRKLTIFAFYCWGIGLIALLVALIRG